MTSSADDMRKTSTKPPKSHIMIPLGRDRNLVSGCVLTILSGALALANGLATVVFESSLSFGLDLGIDRYAVCGFMVIVFGAVAIMGGLYSLKRRRISFALAGAALGMSGGGLIGFWCGLGALVALIFSHEDL